MRVGVVIGRTGGYGDTPSEIDAEYRRAVDAGLTSVWMTQHLGLDALTLMASWGTTGPEIGTAVVPVQTRHPVALAEQALTTHALVGGRLNLGLGLAHAATLESVYGLPPRRSVSYLADYVALLDALMGGEKTSPNETFPIAVRLGAALPSAPPILLAALGPRMLQLAGQHTTGTITWMTGPRTIATHVAPSIRAAAEAAGRPEPRVVVCLPVCVTDDINDARRRHGAGVSVYEGIPSYRAMLDREGVTEPIEVALIGPEDHIQEAVAGLLAGGATDVVAIPLGDPDERAATWELLSAMSRA